MESSGVPFSLSLRLWEYHRHDRRIELPMHSHLFWQLNMAEAGTAEFVTPDAPPFLILHGDKDTTVPFAQSEALYDALTAANVPCELCTVEGAGHATAEFAQPELLCRVADWLDSTLSR